MAKKKTDRFLDKLSLRKTPEIDKKRTSAKKGKKFRLPLSRFMHQLFDLNCTLPPSKKMTDGEIVRQIQLEYSHVDSYMRRFSMDNPDVTTEIATYRSNYNTGKLIPSLGPPDPEKTSFAYNIKGLPVNQRYDTPKPLNSDEIRKAKELTRVRRERYEKKRSK